MHQVKNLGALRIEAAKAEVLQAAVSEIVRRCFGKFDFSLKRCATPTSTSEKWIYIRWCNGHEFGLKISQTIPLLRTSGGQFEGRSFWEKSIILVQRLNLDPCGPGRCSCGRRFCGVLVEAPRENGLALEHYFDVHFRPSEPLVTSVGIWENAGVPLSAEQNRITALPVLRVAVTLWLGSSKIDLNSFDHPTKLADWTPYLSREGMLPMLGRLSLSCGKIRFNIEEQNMTADQVDGAFDVKLCLGSIEIELQDALCLETGMVLELERPQIFEGQLLLSGARWADVQVEINSDTVSLQIQRLHG